MPLYELACDKCETIIEYYHPKATDEDFPCPTCGGPAERLYSLVSVQIFEAFKTRNIDPDGKEIEIKSQRQLSRLCNEHGVVHARDKS